MAIKINVQDALKEAGGVTRLSLLLNVTRTSIYRWVKDKADLPELYGYRLVASRKKR